MLRILGKLYGLTTVRTGLTGYDMPTKYTTLIYMQSTTTGYFWPTEMAPPDRTQQEMTKARSHGDFWPF